MAPSGPAMRLPGACLAAACALAASVAPAAAAAPPPPLSQAAAAPSLRSTAGSGAFGSWTVDRLGLPAFRYRLDHTADPRAAQPELRGDRRAQHQVGNDRIVAAAFNHGWTQLWSQERRMQWANLADEAGRHHVGGFGWLRAGRRTLSTLYLDRPRGAATQRVFAIGAYRRSVRAGGLSVAESVAAPFGDDPVLVHDVAVTNHTRRTQRVSWFEYWAVNPFDRTRGRQIARARAALGRPRAHAARGAAARRRRRAPAHAVRRRPARARGRPRDVRRGLLRHGLARRARGRRRRPPRRRRPRGRRPGRRSSPCAHRCACVPAGRRGCATPTG